MVRATNKKIGIDKPTNVPHSYFVDPLDVLILICPLLKFCKSDPAKVVLAR